MASRQPSPPDSRPKTSILFLAIAISVSLLITLVILYLLYRFWYSLVHRSRTSPYDSTAPLNKLQRFSYRELKNATNNFSESNTIGRGGSGTVFRGILKDGKLVAVKLLDSTSLQCEQEFQNELKILGGLKYSFLVCLLGFCVDKRNRLVVYEYMPNKSLQESLFVDSDNGGGNIKNSCLNWTRRYSIILDVTKALAFLHLECEPAVIHGDVKPSNVLLDSEFRAKLSDFGLSRMKLEEEIGVDLYSQDLAKSQELWKSRDLSENLNAGGVAGEEVNFALALQASSSLQTSGEIHHSDSRGCNMKGKELLSDHNGGEDCDKFMPYDYDVSDMDHSKDVTSCNEDNNYVCVGTKQWGKDWWWRQDGSGELSSKDYVNEWIGTQICSSPNPNWDEEMGGSHEQANLDNCQTRGELAVAIGKPVKELGIVYTNTVVENDERKGIEMSQHVCKKKHRKMHEWWKEECLDELDDKNRSPKTTQVWSKKWLRVPHFGLGKSFHFRRKKKMGHQKNRLVKKNVEFSFREGCRRKKARSTGSDMWSGDLFSRELSSTTSMRGTLCYVAPEYSGSCGYLMEKADIYSLGVLILVIVSGRRPLHVLSSPMKPEKANLVSWSRLLASSGSLLELVDERLNGDYNKEQASMCINLALSCIQKMPELRPDIGDIVKILNGERELLPLPFEFSPSPTSRRRFRCNAAH